jgi:hypothetical protein
VAQVLILLGVLAGMISLGRWLSRDQRIDRHVRTAFRRSISDFDDGAMAAVSGIAVPAVPPLVAPLSRRACIYYEVDVQAFDSSCQMWGTVHAESAGQDFLIQDATGAALVRSGRWKISVQRGARFVDASWSGRDPTLDQFLSRRGLVDFGGRQLRWRERLLLAGDRLEVSGLGRREPCPEPEAAPGDYRSVALRLTLLSARTLPVFITDRFRPNAS